MRIVYCLPRYSTAGGTERTISNKANYFADVLGYEVAIVSTENENTEIFYEWSPKIKLVNLSVYYSGFKNANSITKLFQYQKKHRLYRKKLEQFIFDYNPDVVISCFWYDYTFLYKINHPCKKFLEFHFSRFYKLVERPNLSLPQHLYLKWAHWKEKQIVSKYDKFILLTERDQELWGNPKNSVVISNMCTFYPEQMPNYTRKRVISVGRLSHQKGFDLLIDIWVKINEKFPHWELHLFGDGADDYKQILNNKIADGNLDSVIKIHPNTNDILKEYLDSSIYAMTSRYEGLPMVLIEAMSVGLPVVAFDCDCGPADLIKPDINGFLVPMGKDEEWIKKITNLMMDSDLRSTIGNNARKSMISLNPDSVMQKWLNIINE